MLPGDGVKVQANIEGKVLTADGNLEKYSING